MGNDLTAGHTWDETTLGKRVDADNLNLAFSGATLKETVISARTAKTTLVLTDEILLTDGALKKATMQALATLLTANPDAKVITDRTEVTTLATDDWFLVYDTSATALKKVQMSNLGAAIKAWVSFNGTGTVAINASFNVSSITDNGTGDYTVNFTTAMADANYGAFPSLTELNPLSYGIRVKASGTLGAPVLKSTTQCRFIVGTGAGTPADATEVMIQFVR